MCNVNSPGIQAYVNQKLNEQLEQITERIILRHINSFYKPEYSDVEYYTGLPREKIEEISERCRRKELIKRAYKEGYGEEITDQKLEEKYQEMLQILKKSHRLCVDILKTGGIKNV